MSQEEARAFVKDARLDKVLWMALRNYDLSHDPAKVMPLAVDRGYDFTTAELDEALKYWDHKPPPVPADPVAEVSKEASWRHMRLVVMCGLFAVVFGYLFFDSYRDYAHLRDHGITAVGVVEERGSKERTGRYSWGREYYVEVSFQMYGTHRTITLRESVSKDMYDVYGYMDTAVVIYDPNNPQTARLDMNNSPDYVFLLAAIGFGLICLLAVVWMMSLKNSGLIKRFNDARRGIRILG